MAGLLAANMLRRLHPTLLEAQLGLPDNHGALLRFRSDAVARATGVPLKRVTVQKAVFSNGRLRPVATLADANQYSVKVTGEAVGRSILNLEPGTRYIAPDSFLSELARDINDIRYGQPLERDELLSRLPDSEPAISTIPMPVLMGMCGWPNPHFKFRGIWSSTHIIQNLPLDLYQTIYYPGAQPYYRASITGDRLIIEYAREPVAEVWKDAYEVLIHFGLGDVTLDTMQKYRHQKYGKLLPISEDERKTFILAMTDRFNIYSVGRFATWRQILLDDVVQDIELVNRFITQRDSYARKGHWPSKV